MRAADALHMQLAMIAGHPLDGFIEVRWRREIGGMGQMWIPADRRGAYIEATLRLGANTDTYVGAAPRRQRRGGKTAIDNARCLWVDCDDQGAADRLRAFDPSPTLLLRSGREGGLHGWWMLREPVAAPYALEQALRRVAHAVGGDPKCCDTARMMRAAGTFNHKRGEPVAVEIEQLEPGRVYEVADVVGLLPDPPVGRPWDAAGEEAS